MQPTDPIAWNFLSDTAELENSVNTDCTFSY
jgi:hypothetical protein